MAFLRPAAHADASLLFTWQRDPCVRRFFRNPAPPTAAEHAAWFAERMARSDPMMWIAEIDAAPVGMVRMDAADSGADDFYEVSIIVAPEHQGRGFAVRMLDSLARMFPACRLCAEIAPQNIASVRAFEKAGFRRTRANWVEKDAARIHTSIRPD